MSGQVFGKKIGGQDITASQKAVYEGIIEQAHSVLPSGRRTVDIILPATWPDDLCDHFYEALTVVLRAEDRGVRALEAAARLLEDA